LTVPILLQHQNPTRSQRLGQRPPAPREFSGLTPICTSERIENYNPRYFALFEQQRAAWGDGEAALKDLVAPTMADFGYRLDPPLVRPWSTPIQGGDQATLYRGTACAAETPSAAGAIAGRNRCEGPSGEKWIDSQRSSN
jgi:hypothetical protein